MINPATQELIELINKDSKDMNKVLNLYNEGADLNAIIVYPKQGRYPLIAKAVVRQNYRLVDFMIHHGGKVNVNLTTVEGDKTSLLELAEKLVKSATSHVANKIYKLIQNKLKKELNLVDEAGELSTIKTQ